MGKEKKARHRWCACREHQHGGHVPVV